MAPVGAVVDRLEPAPDSDLTSKRQVACASPASWQGAARSVAQHGGDGSASPRTASCVSASAV